MFPIPHIQIETTYPKMEYEMRNASIDITPAKRSVSYQKDPLKFEIEVTSPAQFEIEQEAAWEATGLGGNQFFSNQIYTESRNVVMQAIAKMVDNGNRMATITKGTVIHELHESEPLKALDFNYTGSPSLDNVAIKAQRKEIRINISPGQLRMDSQTTEAQFNYSPFDFSAYMAQKNQVQITPPRLDIKV
jgi:hypothetical protein